MMGMKMRSTPASTRLRMCPWTSLAGKHTVSDVTCARPRSYIALVLRPETRTLKPSVLKNVDQNGMVSQNSSTRGMPIVTSRPPLTGTVGYDSNSSFSRSTKRLGAAAVRSRPVPGACASQAPCGRSSSAAGTSRTSSSHEMAPPRGQRLPVT